MTSTNPPMRLDLRTARRLALASAGLLKCAQMPFVTRARGSGGRARKACHAVIEHFGYLQLDSIAVSGTRTQGIVLASRLDGLDARLSESLLAPGEPLFEYWGHEASWLPMALYPVLEFRRKEFHVHPWWADFLAQHRQLADALLNRIASNGAIRSADLDDAELRSQLQSEISHIDDTAWTNKLGTRLLEALWSAGLLAVRERRAFHRFFDLPERVIPQAFRRQSAPSVEESIATLLLKALDGHGFATTGTLAATWRLRNRREQIDNALAILHEQGMITASVLQTPEREIKGWVRSDMRDVIEQLASLRPRRDRGVLLSPFDPILWDRTRTRQLFGFDLVIEIYKPAAERQFGYYCLPVLAGERLIGRVDLKADRREGALNILNRHFEPDCDAARDRAAFDCALQRFAASVSLELSH